MKSTDLVLERFSNQTWHKMGKWYHCVVWSEMLIGESTKYMEKRGLPFKKSMGVWLNNGDTVVLESEWLALVEQVKLECKKNPNFLEKYAKECLAAAQDLLDFADSIQKKNVSALTNTELAQIYTSFMQKEIEYMPFMLSLHGIDTLLTERFGILLQEFTSKQKLTKEDFFLYQTALTFPYKKIFVLEEKEKLLKLAAFIQTNKLSIESPEAKKALESHTEEYAWINAGIFEKPPYTLEDFKQRLMDLLASDARIQYETFIRGEEEIKKDQGKYMKEISAYPELLDISKSIQIYGYLRSYRIDVVHKAFVRIFPAVYEIMKRLELEEQDFKNLTSEEIRIGLLDPKNSKHQEIVRERKQGSSSFIIGDELIELSGADMAKLSSLIKLKEEKITGIVRGSTAYPGKITAPCKVLFHLEDMKKVNKGDIMVISMTDPNYIPAMDRAAAFVTDQGGILCHAAIVSREMKKPCIIGTKIATKSFKDGDILEVDADNGVVTKL